MSFTGTVTQRSGTNRYIDAIQTIIYNMKQNHAASITDAALIQEEEQPHYYRFMRKWWFW